MDSNELYEYIKKYFFYKIEKDSIIIFDMSINNHDPIYLNSIKNREVNICEKSIKHILGFSILHKKNKKLLDDLKESIINKELVECYSFAIKNKLKLLDFQNFF